MRTRCQVLSRASGVILGSNGQVKDFICSGQIWLEVWEETWVWRGRSGLKATRTLGRIPWAYILCLFRLCSFQHSLREAKRAYNKWHGTGEVTYELNPRKGRVGRNRHFIHQTQDLGLMFSIFLSGLEKVVWANSDNVYSRWNIIQDNQN